MIVLGIVCQAAAQTVGAAGVFRQEGTASWYGFEFDGKPTASGELFNSTLFTAAHPTLPFGTVLMVTNRNNMRSVTVRVNDRGPFVPSRIIDLSRAAAEALDMLHTGTAPVVIEQVVSIDLGPVASSPPIIQPFVENPVPAQPSSAPVTIVTIPPQVTQPAPVQSSPQSVQGSTAQAVNPQSSIEANLIQPIPPSATQMTATQPAAVQPAPQQVPPAEPIQQIQPAPQPVQPVQTPVQPAAAQPVQPIQPEAVFFPAPPARLTGTTPEPGSNRLYRLQVGSYSVPRNAVDVFERLRTAGLSPNYEQYENFYRVVLANIRAEEIPAIAQTLGNLGFRDVMVRAEN